MAMSEEMFEKRQSLARTHNATKFGSKIDFKAGFDAAYALMNEREQKLIVALKSIACDDLNLEDLPEYDYEQLLEVVTTDTEIARQTLKELNDGNRN